MQLVSRSGRARNFRRHLIGGKDFQFYLEQPGKNMIPLNDILQLKFFKWYSTIKILNLKLHFINGS